MIRAPANWLSGALVCALSLYAAGVAAERPKAPPGYVDDTRGSVVLDQQGECVKTNEVQKGAPCPEKPAAKAEAPKPVPRPEKVTLAGETLFDFNKYNLRPEGKRELGKAVTEIRAKLQGLAVEQRRISVTGHTDSVGSDAYNLKLSQRRAQTVREFMVEQGVDPSIIEARGLGESQPVASNATPEGRQQNRRVEIEFTALVRPKS
jgi:OOP family OmpA-OmpF porin